jgi:hypothetical protein
MECFHRGIVTALLGLVLGQSLAAQEPVRGKTTHELDLIPKDALIVVHLRAGDLWQRFGPLGVLAQLTPMEVNLGMSGEKELGFPFTAVDRFTLFVPKGEEQRRPPVNILVTNQPMERTKVLEAIHKARYLPRRENDPPQRQDKQIQGRTVYFFDIGSRQPALCFLSDRMVMYGELDDLQVALEAADTPNTSFFVTELRKQAQANPALLIGFHLEQIPRRQSTFLDTLLQSPTLSQATACYLALRGDQGLLIQATAHYPDETAAANARTSFAADVQKLRGTLPRDIREVTRYMVENPDAPTHYYALLKTLDADMQKSRVEVTGTVARAELRHACDDRFLAGLLSDQFQGYAGAWGTESFTFTGFNAPQPARVRPARAEALQKIAIAFQKYKEKNGQFPPPAIYAKDGTPLLSWRVALLPYLGEEELYQQFKLEEPWYSKHNGLLLTKIPKVYGGTESHLPGRTPFRMILGPGAVYEGSQGVQPADLKDRASQALVVVENVRLSNAVAWTRPEGYRFRTEWPLPKMTLSERDKGFYALFADGKVRFLPDTISKQTFRAMILKNGPKLEEKDLGEVVK